jgi:PAS domain S-box-containing protein
MLFGGTLQGLGPVEGRFQELLEVAPDAMLVIRADGKLVLVNQQVELLFGYARAELIGQSCCRNACARSTRSFAHNTFTFR